MHEHEALVLARETTGPRAELRDIFVLLHNPHGLFLQLHHLFEGRVLRGFGAAEHQTGIHARQKTLRHHDEHPDRDSRQRQRAEQRDEAEAQRDQ